MKTYSMFARCTFGILSCITLVGCVSSSTVVYEDESTSTLPRLWLGNAHRVWIRDRVIHVEIDQVGGYNLAHINYRLSGDDVLLSPGIFISSGSPGKEMFTVDLSSESLPENWQDHVYWSIRPSYAFCRPEYWDKSLQKPERRIKIILSTDSAASS